MFNWIFTSPHILGCRFVNNSAFGDMFTGGGGGAILDSDGANSTIVDTIFESNHATRRGGAVYADYGSSPTISNSVFARNQCDGLGGALYTDNRASRVGATGTRVSNSIFRHNAAGQYGGAAADYNEVSSIYTGCKFEHNTAAMRGGAVATLYESTQVCTCRGVRNVGSGGVWTTPSGLRHSVMVVPTAE